MSTLKGFGRVEFIPALTQPTKALIVVSHGLGDTSAGWSWLPRAIRQISPKFNDVAFLFPTARTMPVTWNMGASMPAWYDIVSISSRSITEGDGAPPTGLLDSKSYIHSLMDEYTNKLKLPSSRTVLGGFSQGGAMALTAGFSYPKKLGGIFALSGYLPVQKGTAWKLFDDAGDANRDTPAMMIHGDDDQVVSVQFGKMTAAVLRGHGYDVNMETFDGVPHSIDERGLESLAKYLIGRLAVMDAAGDEQETASKPEEAKSEL